MSSERVVQCIGIRMTASELRCLHQSDEYQLNVHGTAPANSVRVFDSSRCLGEGGTRERWEILDERIVGKTGSAARAGRGIVTIENPELCLQNSKRETS